MTRMDLLRKTLYGGYRSTDTVGDNYETVLERHFLPVDVHAFVKVYSPYRRHADHRQAHRCDRGDLDLLVQRQRHHQAPP